MTGRKLLNIVFSVSVLASLLLVGRSSVLAQGPVNGGAPQYAMKAARTREKIDKRVTHDERQAAADRAAAAGFTFPKVGAAQLIPGEAPHYFSHPNYANSPLPMPYPFLLYLPQVRGNGPGPGTSRPWVPHMLGGMRKFVDGLPGLTAAGANGLGQYIPLAHPDIVSFPGSDFYEIAVVQYQEKMHSDLPPTTLRGYVQLSNGTNVYDAVTNPTGCVPAAPIPIGSHLCTAADNTILPEPVHYLGPAIAATKDRPVRILFRNLLPTGVGGNLFVPTDITVMGSGMGPALAGMVEPPASQTTPTCGLTPKPDGCYTENRATLHLHGGITPWISDGTPHQWITPAGERPYPDGTGTTENKGVSVQDVPDMWFDAAGTPIASCAGQTTCGVAGATNQPGDGAQTFYYTNQQSARLLFYHDHAWGITRLNVYAGEAAPYLITDATEQALLTDGLLPGAADTIPLVIQDKTFVPSEAQLTVSDETWDAAKWGGEGNLWLPHVYSPAQNPGDSSGVNQFGRWAYGPWFWPPTSNILYPPVANPYYDSTCDPDLQWCEPPMMPGTPSNSMGMEAFHDTPIVNGTAYPTVTLDPKAYRFRILNAAGDRFLNLHFYKAVDAAGALCNAANSNPLAENTGVACTEVALNPAEVAAALTDPAGVFPTPLAGTEGPDWIQFGTEGGFLPAPVVIPPQPITWVTDPTVFNAGNVDQHSLLLGPAERADVVVDFSAYAGQTLILYNDAPAAFPARDPRYDYYTGNPDLRDTGGAPSTLPGYGPNTRTVMQVKVANAAPAPAYNIAPLQAAFAHHLDLLGDPAGVFESSQHPIIVGQGAYNSAYGTTFQNSGPLDGFARITDFSLTFKTLANWNTAETMSMPFQTKAIQDEMGEAFDRDYGRMSGNLGLEVPLVGGVLQNLVIYPYVNPASELIDATNLPKGNVKVAPISVNTDGTQIWKITHNGVDTHPIHFHLYDVQLINRVGWDGIIRPPDANELGWKDTVRVSPLEDTIVALRPVIPVVPFDLPNSIRPLNPMAPLGSTLAFNYTDANANPTAAITNEMTNFGWEYVWHCHILSHEEMDMMRPQAVAVPPNAPTGLSATYNGANVVLTWTDNSANETGFLVQRADTAAGAWTDLATLAANVTTYTDTTAGPGLNYRYQLVALNKVGYGGPAAQPNAYATLQVKSAPGSLYLAPAPTVLSAQVQAGPPAQVLLSWADNTVDETGFVIERADNGGPFAPLIAIGPNPGTGTVNYTDTTVVAGAGNTYDYRVAAENAGVLSGYSNVASAAIP
jgi:FtsP/CotA-like multicopper oxidase with cupredoxin domain